MQRFSGRVALITGASRGIGLAIAERLVSEGARVCLTARNPQPLAEATRELGGQSVALGVPGHADDPEHRAEAVAAALSAFGKIDVLVNNTGINPVFGAVLDMEDSATRKIFDVNVGASLGWLRNVHDACFSQHGGVVVNITAVAGLRPARGIGMYGASKAAVTHLTAQLAQELGPEIRVNALAPALIKTKFAARLYEGREEALAAEYSLRRLGTPEDIAAAAAFLASDDAAWITGQTLVVDGGMVLSGGGV
jgi:NAD(P)-dependent dehydrogenase (short-subunit alcohol dehydrogenase family)